MTQGYRWNKRLTELINTIILFLSPYINKLFVWNMKLKFKVVLINIDVIIYDEIVVFMKGYDI